MKQPSRILAAYCAAVAVFLGLLWLQTSPKVAHAQDPPIGPTLVTEQDGTRIQNNTKIMNFTGGGCTVTATGTTANVACTGGGGGGTVTSITATAPVAASPNPITGAGTLSFAVTNQANGDLIYYNSGWDNRLAIGTASAFLRSTGTLPAWSTTTWPNSATTGDILYASGSNTYANLAKCNAGQHLRWNGTIPTCSEAYTTSATLNSGTTGAGNVDVTAFAIPAGTTSNTNSFLMNGVVARVLQAMVGAGTITLSCGASGGAQDYLLNQTVTSATGVGTAYGLTTAQAGTAFTSANMYNALVNGSGSVVCRSSLSGVATTQAVFLITTSGESI